MGLKSSKSKKRTSSDFLTTSRRPSDLSYTPQNILENVTEYDRSIINELQKELQQKPDQFILNHLLMSTMFFENFENEVWTKPKSTSNFEKDLNPTLMRDFNKRCFLPDIHFQNVNRHVRFQPMHGPNKNKSEPLVPERMYIIHENIEVIDDSDPHYNNIDKPSIKIEIKIANHDGYVKLKKLNVDEARSDSTESLDRPSASSNIVNSKMMLSSNSSTISSNDEADERLETNDSDYYDYSRITDLRTPKSIEIENVNLPHRLSDVPYNCIISVREKNMPPPGDGDEDDSWSDEDVEQADDWSTNDDVEEDFVTRIRKQRQLELMRKEEQEREYSLYKIVHYINSTEFARFFQNQVFPGYLGERLEFKEEDIKEATATPGVIFCKRYNNNYDGELSQNYEIMPAVSIKSSRLTPNWTLKDRPKKTDSRMQIYQWPNEHMVHEAFQFETLAVPIGFVKKRGENKETCLEWELQFPHVEKYLVSKMTHAQMKAYLFLIVLFKTYIEPMTMKNGLLIDHIRTLIYLECEANYRDWPDHRLGDRLLMVLANLKCYLGWRKLPDFFVPNKNLFVNVPGKFLIRCQKQIHDILENPTMHFLVALRNLKYTNTHSFYPYPDYTGLYNILTDRTMNTISPDLQQSIVDEEFREMRRRKYNPQQKWKYEKLKQSRKKKQKMLKEAPVETNRKQSTDSIDLEFTCADKIDTFRIISILTFFIKHFLDVAASSKKIASPKQVLLYLKYAWYLTKILEMIPTQKDVAQTYLERIAKEEVHSARVSVLERTTAPATPKRNSIHFFNEQLIGSSKLRQDQLNETESKISKQLKNVYDASRANRAKVKSGEFKKVGIRDAVEIVG